MEFHVGNLIFAIVAMIIVLGILLRRKHRKEERQMCKPKASKMDIYIDPILDVIYLTIDDKDCQIKKSDLYTFLDRTDRLEWLHDYNDPRQMDGHGQQAGKYSEEDYFTNVPLEEIKTDILLYLKSLTV